MWVLAIAWFVGVIRNYPFIWNFFRIPVPIATAQYVCVTVAKSAEVTVANPTALLSYWMAFQESLGQTTHYSKTVPVLQSEDGKNYMVFECKRYIVQPDGSIKQAEAHIGPTNAEIHAGGQGLTIAQHRTLINTVGQNFIPFGVSPLGELIAEEIVTFFYLYQIMMYVVWFWFSYLIIAGVLFMVVCGSAIINIYLKRSNQATIADMCRYSTKCAVKRNGDWEPMCDSNDLVPGDVIRVKGLDWVLPCDLVLISGTAVCDESGLTGESMPISKSPLLDNDTIYDAHSGKAHTLYAGTICLQTGTGEGDDETIAVVSATGINTGKGELISQILFPVPMRFKYDEELPLVVAMLLVYAAVCFISSLVLQSNSGSKSTWTTKWAYAVFTVSQIVSPLLPITLMVGQIMSAQRLAEKEVFCLNPKRIAISGKIRVQCFDKTGTLTKEGLDFLGAQESAAGAFRPVSGGSNKDMAGLTDLTRWALATCHACHAYGDGLVGNQVEVKMFTAVGWDLIEKKGDDTPVVKSPSGETLTIVKRFEFQHARMSMSVIVKDSAGICHAFCKGSYERIKDLVSSGQASTLPGDFDSVSKKHALEGCYVLGLAHKKLGELTDAQIHDISRDASEEGLSCLGLILFRNELKEDSRAALVALKKGCVRSVMITGDNAQCGCYIARTSAMVEEDSRVILADLNAKKQVVWKEMGVDGAVEMSTEDIKIEVAKAKHFIKREDEAYISMPASEDPNVNNDIELAVTQKAFDKLVASGDMDDLLFFTRIYSRMSPEGKVDVVQMHMARGLIVGMCGDGGNDCGALRAAHAGVALSEAEASVVSPFTSRTKSVQSVVDLHKEGRASLAISFGSYKFLITYGQLFSVLKLVCFYYGVIMCMMDYLMIDGIAVLCLSYVLTLSHPVDELPAERPTSSLLGPSTLSSVIGMQVINVCILMSALAIMRGDNDYIVWPASKASGASWWTLGDNWETTVVFTVVFSQFVTSGLIFTFGGKWRKPVWENLPLFGFWLFAYVFTSYLMLSDANSVTDIFHIASRKFNSASNPSPVWEAALGAGVSPPSMSTGLRFQIWLLTAAGLLLAVAWEGIVIIGPVRDYFHKKYPPTREHFKF